MRTFLGWSCLLVTLVLAASVAFLRRTSVMPQVSGVILAQTSQDWGSIPFAGGECAVVNNTWNKAAAGKGFEQSVFLEEVSGKKTIGWQWRAPWQLFPNVVSQPEIICGNKPWAQSPAPKRDSHFALEQNAYALSSRSTYAHVVFTTWFSACGACPIFRLRGKILPMKS